VILLILYKYIIYIEFISKGILDFTSKLIKRMDVMRKVILSVAMIATSLFAVESAELYKHCVVCHGKQGELVAIKSSPQLSSLSEEELSLRLKNILDGSTQLSKKYVTMHKIKLQRLTPEKTDELAKYIVNLKK
jgi:cytochrome c